ncbi:hypothetical protein LQZ18_11015 [Lachnospiraceae bacterium ZAX-1]
MEIGVLIDQEGFVTNFEQGGIMTVYSVSEGNITQEREREYTSVADKSPAAIRESLRELGGWLGSCKVIVTSELNGIYFTVLEGLLFNMWEMTGKPADFLDYIHRGELEEQKKANLPEKIYAPTEKGRGVFTIDLDFVMNSDSGLSSKKVLLPFLQKENFKALEVKCNHIPRWFEVELPGMKLKYKAEKTEDGFLATLTPESL